MKEPVLLIILDGFGIAPRSKGNAITEESAPHIFEYMKRCPSTTLTAHGKAVGLFGGQSGNSEAGHLNIGAGRVVKQDIVHISEAISDGTFFKNEAFRNAIAHVKKHKSSLHLLGLLTDGQSAHAHPDHVYALLEHCHKQKVKDVYLHLFTDGRDSTPHSALHYVQELKEHMTQGQQIASVMGRFYGMDRNKMWGRTRKAYQALVLGKGHKASSVEEAITNAYNREESDEYIEPTIIVSSGKSVGTIRDTDAVIFFNARSDRARQLTKVFVQKDFKKKNPGSFVRSKKPKDLAFVAMTDFGPDLDSIAVAFPSPDVQNSLAKAIGEEYRQLYISETEKYAHVTFFINGGYAHAINGEKRELIPSTGDKDYAKTPRMSSGKVTKRILQHLKKKDFDFICVNFPNADMLGHTGNIDAAKKGISIMDAHVKELVDAVLSKNGHVMITADHGNAEEMLTKKGEPETEHTKNAVPLIIISNTCKTKKLKKGRLADVAPTLLHLMGIKKPVEMNGKSLL